MALAHEAGFNAASAVRSAPGAIQTRTTAQPFVVGARGSVPVRTSSLQSPQSGVRFAPVPGRSAVQRSLGLPNGSTVLFPGDFHDLLNQEADAWEQTPTFAVLQRPLQRVALSSPIHWAENLNEKFDKVVTQPWGWSFATKSIQEKDVRDLNEYIAEYNAETLPVEESSSLASRLVQPLPKHFVDWEIKGNKIEYVIHGRRYSTHDDSPQLYPIKGKGIACGCGVHDMYYLLKDLGRDTPARVIRLHEILIGSSTSEYQQALQEKMSGGHRSGVELPNIETTSAKTIEKMNPLKLVPRLKAARTALESTKRSLRFKNKLAEGT